MIYWKAEKHACWGGNYKIMTCSVFYDLKLPCFGKPDPREIFIRGRIRRYSRAEIGKATEVEVSPEGRGDNREKRSRGYTRRGYTMHKIK
jgi:hypothetical protein